MKKTYKRVILLIVFSIILIFCNAVNVYAATDHPEVDGKDEGATGTYSSENKTLQISKEGGTASYGYVTYTLKADASRPIYQGDTITVKIHARRNLWTGNINIVDGEYDKTTVEEISKEHTPDYNGINETDITINLKPLKTGDLTYQAILKDNSQVLINVKIVGVKSLSEKFEKEIRSKWGTGYYERKVISEIQGPSNSVHGSNDLDIVIDRLMKGQYSGTNNDSSTSNNPNYDAIYEYTKTSDSSWSEVDGYLGNVIKRTVEADCTVIKDFGKTVKTGEVYKFKYQIYYLKDKNKIIYTYSKNQVKLSNGETTESVAGQESEKNFDNRIDEAEKIISEMQASWDSTYEQRENNKHFDDVLTNLNAYKPDDTVSADDAEKLESKISVILTVITTIGIILSVLMLAFIGIKYMLGSVEEKAEYKKDMVPYLVGAILLFGITTIIKVLQEIGTSINNI